MDVTNTLAEKKTMRVTQEDKTADTRHTQCHNYGVADWCAAHPLTNHVHVLHRHTELRAKTNNANPNIRVTFFNLGYF